MMLRCIARRDHEILLFAQGALNLGTTLSEVPNPSSRLKLSLTIFLAFHGRFFQLHSGSPQAFLVDVFRQKEGDVKHRSSWNHFTPSCGSPEEEDPSHVSYDFPGKAGSRPCVSPAVGSHMEVCHTALCSEENRGNGKKQPKPTGQRVFMRTEGQFSTSLLSSPHRERGFHPQGSGKVETGHSGTREL